MSNDLYRDANVGVRARLAVLSTRIVDREEEVTDDALLEGSRAASRRYAHALDAAVRVLSFGGKLRRPSNSGGTREAGPRRMWGGVPGNASGRGPETRRPRGASP